MKNLKTLFVAVFCASISFTSFSQTDSDCVSARWISVKNPEHNSALFAAMPEILKEVKRQTDLKLLFGSTELFEVGPMSDDNGTPLTQINKDGEEVFIYQEKTIETIQSDVPLIDEFGYNVILTLEDGTQSFVYTDPIITSLQSDVPLVDKNGDPIIMILDDGTEAFVYPYQFDFSVQSQTPVIDGHGEIRDFQYGDPVHYSISERAISELRIVEVREYDEETEQYTGKLKISRIGFCMNSAHTQQEQLWIDADQFFENIKNPEDNAWYILLKELNYVGFEYKQLPCPE